MKRFAFLLILVLLCAPALAMNQTPAPYIADPHVFRVPAKYNSIQSAITAATALGGTVLIAPGTYTTSVPIILPSNVRLVGSGQYATKIKLANCPTPTTTTGSTVAAGATSFTVAECAGFKAGQYITICLAADYVANGDHYDCYAQGIYGARDTLIVATVSAASGAGTITVTGGTKYSAGGGYAVGAKVFVTNNVITCCTMAKSTSNNDILPTEGTGSSNIEISDLEIDGNYANQHRGQSYGAGQGIELGGCTNVTLRNLYIHDTAMSGISMDPAGLDATRVFNSNVLVDNCKVTNAAALGCIRVHALNNSRFRTCVIAGNSTAADYSTWAAFVMSHSWGGVSIDDCDISASNYSGLVVATGANNVQVNGGYIHDCARYGLYFYGATGTDSTSDGLSRSVNNITVEGVHFDTCGYISGSYGGFDVTQTSGAYETNIVIKGCNFTSCGYTSIMNSAPGTLIIGNTVDMRGPTPQRCGIWNNGVGAVVQGNHIECNDWSGPGSNLTLDTTASGGALATALVHAGGTGYVVGDVLSVTQAGGTYGTIRVAAAPGGVVSAVTIYFAGSGYGNTGSILATAHPGQHPGGIMTAPFVNATTYSQTVVTGNIVNCNSTLSPIKIGDTPNGNPQVDKAYVFGNHVYSAYAIPNDYQQVIGAPGSIALPPPGSHSGTSVLNGGSPSTVTVTDTDILTTSQVSVWSGTGASFGATVLHVAVSAGSFTITGPNASTNNVNWLY